MHTSTILNDRWAAIYADRRYCGKLDSIHENVHCCNSLPAFRKHEKDTGSTELQIAQLSARVRHLTEHLKRNRKDYACERGLRGILGQRTALLKYLFKTDQESFARTVRQLQIKNPIKSVVLRK
jgi:small subunit ribosomal protein S15